jgi:anaerobic magnesium-protoporphyrin IX monomethyl ester cyclase
MIDVALIDLFNSGNFGIRSLAAHLEQHGMETAMFFGDEYVQDLLKVDERQIEALRHLSETLSPRLIGLSAISLIAYPLLRPVVQRLKAALPNVPVILGGAAPTLEPVFTLNYFGADYVAIGEAEDSLLALCQRLRLNATGAGVCGILCPGEADYSYPSLRHNLDELPFQKTAKNNSFFLGRDGAVVEAGYRGKTYVTRVSRGCPFRCSYCCNEALRAPYRTEPFVRVRSPAHVVEEIRGYLSQGDSCEDIWFSDDTFPAQSAWIADFTRRYREEVRLPFNIWLNPNSIKEENLQHLKDAGLNLVVVGIESGSEETRKNVFFRTEDRPLLYRVDEMLSRQRIQKRYDFLVDHPWMTPNELDDTVDLLLRLKNRLKSTCTALCFSHKPLWPTVRSVKDM